MTRSDEILFQLVRPNAEGIGTAPEPAPAARKK